MAKGRPKLSKEQSESRKNTFIEIAKRLFLEDGYQFVSMRKIASEASVSPMTLYQSFENKRDILRYIWTDIFIEISKQCTEAIESPNNDMDRLRSFCATFLEYWLNHPEHYRVVYLESDQLKGSDDAYFAENKVVSALFDQLGSLVQPLSPHEAEIDLKVKLLVLQLQGIAHGLITISEIQWGDPKQLLNQCLAAFEQSISI
jgi:AcrR family transcriptional regulator